MLALHSLRKVLKPWLGPYYRQSEVYLNSAADGSLFKRMYWRAEKDEKSARTFRGKVLVIDYQVPKPDRDAGSRNTFEHIVCLKQLNYEVVFWPHDGIDVPRYTDALRKIGVQVVSGYLRPSLKHWLARQDAEVDAVLLNRPHVAEALIDTIINRRLPIVYYGHDLHHARMLMEAARIGDAHLVLKAEEMRLLEHSIWRRVNVSSYPSIEEVERVNEIDPTVTTLHLPAFCYDEFERRTQPTLGAQVMFVGSFRHPPNISAAQWLAREIMPIVRQSVPEATLVIAGAYPTEEVASLSNDYVEVVGWLCDSALQALYNCSRVAVVPLLVGAGVKLKVVESLHEGVPLVTTTVGAQGLPGIEKTVSIGNDAASIAAAVISIMRLDEESWLNQSHRQLGYVQMNFSRTAMKSAIARALEIAKSSAEHKGWGKSK